ncbi:MAG: hypothetical protein ACRBCJ_07040 [Hyphomicrobiaceae bacterium]
MLQAGKRSFAMNFLNARHESTVETQKDIGAMSHTMTANFVGKRLNTIAGMRSILALVLMAMAAATFNNPQALAKDVCVTCQQPKMNYRCRVPDLNIGRASDAAASYLCITAMAKSGGHSECQIQRNPKEFKCLGQIRVLDPKGKILDQDGATVEHTTKGDEQKPNSQQPIDNAAVPKDEGELSTTDAPSSEPSKAGQETDKKSAKKTEPSGPPKTVEELAIKTAEQSKKGLDKAGEAIKGAGKAVGNAAKKSWDCIASLFADC